MYDQFVDFLRDRTRLTYHIRRDINRHFGRVASCGLIGGPDRRNPASAFCNASWFAGFPEVTTSPTEELGSFSSSMMSTSSDGVDTAGLSRLKPSHPASSVAINHPSFKSLT